MQQNKLQPDNTQPKTIIQNGFSFSKGDNLTDIPEGAIIQDSVDGVTRVFDSNGKQLSISNDADSPKIPTPDGYILADRITQIPNGSYIQDNNNGTTNVFLNNQRVLTVIAPANKKTPIPQTTGWVEDVTASGISSLSQYTAYWTVPTSPTNSQTSSWTYIFNAIQPSNNAGIAQPVLEYNYGGSSHAWTAAPWYVDSSNHGYRGNPISTASGHEILGQLLWNTNLQRWDVIITDENTAGSTSEYTTYTPYIGTSDDSAFCALEAYYVNNNSDIPGTIEFTNLQAEDINYNPISFSWSPWVSTNMGLSNLGVGYNGMSYVTLYT